MILSFKMSSTQKQERRVPCEPVPCELCGGYYIRGKTAKAISMLPEHLQCQCIVNNPTGVIMCNGCKTPKVRDGIRCGFHPDDYSSCIPEPCFSRQTEIGYDVVEEQPSVRGFATDAEAGVEKLPQTLSMFSQKEITTDDKGTQCNMCCGSIEQEETRDVSSFVTQIDDCFSSSVGDITESLTEIRFCPLCHSVDRFNGKSVGKHSNILGQCGSDRVSEIIWCNGCSTPYSVRGKLVGHHTDDYKCVPDLEFLTKHYFQHSGCYSDEQFIVLPPRSLSNDEVPCRDCMEVMVPNPVNSDAIGCGYCEDCWTRR